MKDNNPTSYAKGLTLKVSEEEHQSMKILAAHEKKTIKAIIFDALDNTFPGWRQSKNDKK